MKKIVISVLRVLVLLVIGFFALIHFSHERIRKQLIERHDQAMLYFREGNEFFDDGRYEEAIESFQKVLEIEPANSSARYNIRISNDRLTLGNDGLRLMRYGELFNEGKFEEARQILGTINDISLRTDLERTLDDAEARQKEKEKESQPDA